MYKEDDIPHIRYKIENIERQIDQLVSEKHRLEDILYKIYNDLDYKQSIGDSK